MSKYSINQASITNSTLSGQTVVAGDLVITGTITAGVNVSVGAAPLPPMTEYTFSAMPIRERDGWFGVEILTTRSQPTGYLSPAGGKVLNPLGHPEIERRIHLWLADNTQYRYIVLSSSIQFKHEDDAMAFYLRFSGGVTLS